MTEHQCLQQLRDREYELAVLNELGKAVIAKVRLPQVLQLVADRARDMIGAETLLIPMLDQTRECYVYAVAAGKHADEIVGTEFSVEVGMCGWVLRNEKPVLFGPSDKWAIEGRSKWEEGHTSAVLVPLVVQDRIIGGISGTGKVGGGFFTSRDMELLILFANQVSIAIENSRLFQEVNDLVESLESKVAQRTAELEAANYELEAFAHSVSHDLRAPLRSIEGFSLALLEDYAARLDDEGKEYLERLRINATWMGHLIDALLLLSRVTRAEFVRTQVDVSALAAKVAFSLTRAAPDREVALYVEPGMTASGDERLLELALENLLSNAWKYTEKVDQASIRFATARLDGETCFSISDNGAGFDMRSVDKLFKPFQRLHKDSEFNGTGIGLATVKRIVHRHGGWIRAQGSPGHGAVFYFAFGIDGTIGSPSA